jgi:hypothetical protein
VLARASTVSPDEPQVADVPGEIRALGGGFICEVVPALGLRIEEGPGRLSYAQAHLAEKDRLETVEALGALVDGNGDRVPSGFRLAVDSGEATLGALRLG